MKTCLNKWIFWIVTLLGLSWLSLVSASEQEAQTAVKPLTGKLAVAGQIKPQSVAQLKAAGFSTIIDLRPDGESADQPSAKEMREAAQANGVRFHYVPVVPGAIADDKVQALQAALADSPGQVLMYCRSGSRAARTWSLVEAQRPDGMDADSILAAVRRTGQSAEDLKPAIEQRIARRGGGSKELP